MPAGAEGVTPRQPFGRQPAALRHAVLTHSLGRVVGAGRQEATGPDEERGDEQFVRAKERQREAH